MHQLLRLGILPPIVQRGGAEESHPTVKEVASMRRILLVLMVALVMAAMMLAMAMPAFAAPQFGSPGEAGHPTCTKAEPHSPAIEPTEGGDLACDVFPPGQER